jgi:hypothetical protein
MKRPFFSSPKRTRPTRTRTLSPFDGKGGIFLWLLLHGGLFAAFLAFRLLPGSAGFNTNLYDIIPPSRGPEAAADKILGERKARGVVILSAAVNFEEAKKGAALLYGEFSGSAASPAFEHISLSVADAALSSFTRYFSEYR